MEKLPGTFLSQMKLKKEKKVVRMYTRKNNSWCVNFYHKDHNCYAQTRRISYTFLQARKRRRFFN